MACYQAVFVKNTSDKAHPLLQLFIIHIHLINFNLVVPQKVGINLEFTIFSMLSFTKIQNGVLK